VEKTESIRGSQDTLESTQEAQEHVAGNEGEEYDWPDLDILHDISLKAVENHQGYRDTGLLEGAIGNTQMQQMYGAHEDIFDTAANLLAKIQRQQAIIEGNKRTATATALSFLERNGYDTSALAQDGVWEELVDVIYHISDAIEANEDKYIPMLAEMFRKYCTPMQKTAAGRDIANEPVKVIYDFEKDQIILGTPGQVVPQKSKIVGDYDGSNMNLYSTGQEFLNSNYLKRLWHASFPTRPLNNITFESQQLKVRQ
jgi:death-on-curing family protein